MAAARSPYTSGKRGSSGSWSKPRSSTMLAGAASCSSRAASLTKRLTSSAVAAAAGSSARTGSGAAPSTCGSVSPRRHVPHETAGRLRGERGQIRGARRLELRAAGLRPGEPAEPVEREQHDLRGVRQHELADEVEHGVKCTGGRYASLTGLSIEPSLSISTRQTSPGCRKTGVGFMANPTPGGVPVAMRSPGDSVTSPERYETR